MADEQQLRHVESIAKRPRVVSLVASEIRNLETELSVVSAAAVAATALNSYVPLGSFSWDQDNEKKIKMFLEGVNQETVETIFKPMSVDIKFHDIQGKNY